MAGSSMKDIKLRIKSVESTMQITKAMELVASSKIRIDGFVTRARAIRILCRCPPLILVEPSLMTVCIPIGIIEISAAIPAASAAAQASSCVKAFVPIMFVKMSPCIS